MNYEDFNGIYLSEKPTVTCTNVIAYDNEMIVRLSCLVEHADINIEDFVWEMDETDTVFSNDVPANSSTVTAEVSFWSAWM